MHAFLALASRAEPLRCVACSAEAAAARTRAVRVRSNVMRFAHEAFGVWQCASCRSIHATEEVDLDRYYADYPFHAQRMSFAGRLAFRSKLRELERLGLRREHRLLDHGCGSGLFVQYLLEQGYRHARGYDAYAGEGAHGAAPGEGYDFVLSQDVIEHVADPRTFVAELASLVQPGGLLVIGTPDADAIDLAASEQYIHMLHQPYHRHILSRQALIQLARSLGLDVLDVRHGMPGNSLLPGLNARFLRRVLRAHGDTLDATLAGEMKLKWELLTPGALWDACTGGLRDPGYDVSVALRVPAACSAP